MANYFCLKDKCVTYLQLEKQVKKYISPNLPLLLGYLKH